MNQPFYVPSVCPHCNMTTDYLLPIDHGTAHIVKQIARYIGKKGINRVHPRKEMEGTYLTSNDVGNLTRPRAHGLIAKVKGEPGNYLLTAKGSAFLHGTPIPKYAIRSKIDGKTIGYHLPEAHTVIIGELNRAMEYWEGIDYSIEEGRIIRDLVKQPTLL